MPPKTIAVIASSPTHSRSGASTPTSDSLIVSGTATHHSGGAF
jgi:hypothetical protein